MKYIVGITGYKQSGKDTAARYLAEFLYPSIRIGFADSIKEEVATLLDIQVEEIEKKKNHPLIRNALQFWGGYQKEDKGEYYWFNKLLDKLEQVKDGTFVFIPDVRFPHEAEGIHNEDGCIIKVLRIPEYVNIDNHPSEVQVKNVPYNFCILRNDGTDKYKKECEYMAYNVKQFFKLI